MKHQIQMQPHVVLLTESVHQLDRIVPYAVMHTAVYFEAASIPHAVDICLKAAFVFGIEFPSTAHSSWSFVQRAIYGLTSKFDRVSSKTLELMSDIV